MRPPLFHSPTLGFQPRKEELAKAVKVTALKSDCLLPFPIDYCATGGKSLNLSVPQFPQLIYRAMMKMIVLIHIKVLRTVPGNNKRLLMLSINIFFTIIVICTGDVNAQKSVLQT